jgi:hypothetical protein
MESPVLVIGVPMLTVPELPWKYIDPAVVAKVVASVDQFVGKLDVAVPK